jgi:hypothetical protein
MWIIATELLIVCLVGVVLPADAAGKATLKEQFGQEMKQVREGSTSRIRNQAAEDLALMAGKMKPDEIDDRAVTDLISLLDLQEDSVRYWIARTLGNLGPRAKPAIPKLLGLLPEADCLQGSKTSASGIRFALAQLGETPPPRPACKPIGL